MAERTNILEVKNLTKRFSGLVAVNDLSFEVAEHSIHALIGPNGSGKTTTINMIDGVFPPSGGQILFNGSDITGRSVHEISRLGLGRTFQNIKLFNSLTVEENLMVGGHMSYAKAGIVDFFFHFKNARREEAALKEEAQRVLEFMNLQDIAKRQVGGLPYGMLKMVELARTMMTNPRLILLDEPAAGLNPSERGLLIDILARIFEGGVALFLIEHNMDVVMNISHRITVINFGSKIAEGAPVEIQNNPEVIRAYLGDRYNMRA